MYSSSARRLFSTAARKNVVLVDGARIPFTLAGTAYKDYMAVDLGNYALNIDIKYINIILRSHCHEGYSCQDCN
jgi:hypothetical protein